MIGFTISIVGAIVCIYLCGRVAHRRRRSVRLWLWLGATLGPVALVLVALLPSREVVG